MSSGIGSRRLQPRILVERNGLVGQPITYSQEASDYHADALRREGFKLFVYEWYHIPSGKRGISRLWTFSQSAAQTLVEFWSGDDWQYNLVEKELDSGGKCGILPVGQAKGESAMPNAVAEPPKAPEVATVEQIVRKAIRSAGEPEIGPDETLSIRPVGGINYRVNVWQEVNKGGVIADNRISRSFFITIRSPEDVTMTK
jgi:hypothetical protein